MDQIASDLIRQQFPLRASGSPNDTEYLWVLNSMECISGDVLGLFPMTERDHWESVSVWASQHRAEVLLVMLPDLWQIGFHLMRAVRGKNIALLSLKRNRMSAVPHLIETLHVRGAIVDRESALAIGHSGRAAGLTYLHVLYGPREAPVCIEGLTVLNEMHIVPGLPVLIACEADPITGVHIAPRIGWRLETDVLTVTDEDVSKRFAGIRLLGRFESSSARCSCAMGQRFTRL